MQHTTQLSTIPPYGAPGATIEPSRKGGRVQRRPVCERPSVLHDNPGAPQDGTMENRMTPQERFARKVHQDHLMKYRTIKCRNCRKLAAIERPKTVCHSCEDKRWQRSRGGCTALLHHGPGHQSSTYCIARPGQHRKENGRLLHVASYSGGFMEWHGQHGCTGYFDDPVDDPKSGERWVGASGALFSTKERAMASLTGGRS